MLGGILLVKQSYILLLKACLSDSYTYLNKQFGKPTSGILLKISNDSKGVQNKLVQNKLVQNKLVVWLQYKAKKYTYYTTYQCGFSMNTVNCVIAYNCLKFFMSAATVCYLAAF